MDVLAQLQAKADIAEVIHAYCYHFDRAEAERVVALFTEDAVVDYGPGLPTLTGRAEILDTVARGLAQLFAATSHHVSNIGIRLETAERATSVCYLYAWHRYIGGARDGELWGQYHHDFRREDGQWRISRLVLKAAGTDGFHRDTMHPIGRRPPPGG